jgi:hypothetical protein
VPSQIGDLGLGSPGQHPHSTAPGSGLHPRAERSIDGTGVVAEITKRALRLANEQRSLGHTRRVGHVGHKSSRGPDFEILMTPSSIAAHRPQYATDSSGIAQAAQQGAPHSRQPNRGAHTSPPQRQRCADASKSLNCLVCIALPLSGPAPRSVVSRRAITPTAEPLSGRRRSGTRSARRGAPAQLRVR